MKETGPRQKKARTRNHRSTRCGLGRSWGGLGRSWSSLGAALECSWVALGQVRVLLEWLLGGLGGSWVALGASVVSFFVDFYIVFGKSSRCTKLPSTEGRKGGTESFWGVPGAQKALLALRFQGKS